MNELTKYQFLAALLIGLGLLVPYEYYWRVIEQWPLSYDLESLDEWADERERVKDLGTNDIVILGSSRGHFDINIALWDSITGVRPLQLAYPGSSPYFPVEDLVENSEFNGILILSVAPGLFFTTENSWGANRGKAFVDRYHERTYADILNQRIYQHLDARFSYLEQEITYEALVFRLPIPNRDSVHDADLWPPMTKMYADRNAHMIPLMENDTVIQRRQKDIWFNPDPKNRGAEHREEIMEHYSSLLRKFQKRGGRVVLIRPPVDGYYGEVEPRLYPRTDYWDVLVDSCQCPSFHFEDFEETRGMNLPEWSHLSNADARRYTRFLIERINEQEL